MKEEIFALDIGTRKVMGIVARRGEDCLEILDVEMMEHPSRPMFDGQIHSIDEVAKTVKKIKEKLNKFMGVVDVEDITEVAPDIYTKDENVDTSEERVQKTPKDELQQSKPDAV